MEERFCRPVRIYILDRGVPRLKTKGQKKRSIWGEKFRNSELETIFRKIYSETPIFTKYILTHRVQKVKEHFLFFDIFILFFASGKGCEKPAKTGLERFHKISRKSNN